MQLFYCPDIIDSPILDAIESQHCIKVLRHKAGDQIHLIDGKGKQYQGIIKTPNAKACELSDVKMIRSEERSSKLHIAIAPTKSPDRMEWFVEKATEIGVNEVTFIQCQHSERPRINIERLNKKAISATKQNQSLWLPEINPMVSFDEFIGFDRVANKYVAFAEQKDQVYFHQKIDKDSKIETIILIGPEGDFTHTEIMKAKSAGYLTISLGKSVLRTETAGIVACTLFINYNS